MFPGSRIVFQLRQDVDQTTTASTNEYAAFGHTSAQPLNVQNANGLTSDIPTPEELAEQRITDLYSQIDHGKMRGRMGQNRSIKLGRKKRVSPGDPYYMEIRMRHTPLLPVGHTYTAYGRLSETGQKLDEHLVMLAPVGGYAGAGVSGAVPLPGKLEPNKVDCTKQPAAAYRVSLSAEQYEKLLLEVQKVKREKPKYHLFVNNCNHFTSRISESVGIKTPRNKYTSSLIYMYDIIRENEGRDALKKG